MGKGGGQSLSGCSPVYGDDGGTPRNALRDLEHGKH
jgi:hypothetical protein